MPGATAMSVGLSLIAAELRYQLLLEQLGVGPRIVLFVTGTWLSVWGLKEVIAHWWPALGSKHRRRRKRRFRMLAPGYIYILIMIVLFLGSWVGRSNPLMLVFSLMAGPFIVGGTMTFNMLRGLSVGRTVPQRVIAGEPFSVEIQLTNPKRWLSAWLMTVRDRVDNGREYLSPEILFACVPRRTAEIGRYQLRLSQRGRYAFGPLQVNSRFPLGLAERGLVLAEPDEILVYPRIGRLSSQWRRRMRTATQLVSHAQQRVGSFHDDFHRIREYRTGDEPRSIHWRTTARRNELMVREFRESRDRHLIVLLDAWRPDRPTAQQQERVEYAISLAATIGLDQLQSGHHSDVYFAVSSTSFWEWGGSTRHQEREQLLDTLALLQPSPRANLSKLLSAAHREQTPHCRTILVTPFSHRAEAVEGTAVEGMPLGWESIWSDPPQVVVADPAETGQFFFLEPTGSPEGARG